MGGLGRDDHLYKCNDMYSFLNITNSECMGEGAVYWRE